MNGFRTPAQITGFSTRADSSLGFRGCTQELPVEEQVKLMQLKNMLVEMILIPEGATAADIADRSGARPVKNSTPSQQLRFTIAGHHTRCGSSEPPEDFYRARMAEIIQDYRREHLSQP